MRLFHLRLLPALLLAMAALPACTDNAGPADTGPVTPAAPEIPAIAYKVVRYLPHDTTLFTEGLLVHNGQLYESTGSPDDLGYARSMIGTINPATGKMDKKAELDRAKYFGEGIAVLSNRFYQLTYKAQTGFVYDAASFKQTGTFKYANAEGWGMTTDGKFLIMSDGTANLTFLDPDGMKPVKTLAVTEAGAPLERLNELEYIHGFIYANVWTTNEIVKIDPATGKVVAVLDLSSLAFEAQHKNQHVDVMNGIAYDPAADRIYVTGKLWANIYEINFPH